MDNLICKVSSPLFDGIRMEERRAILSCVGYHLARYQKGETIVFEEEHIHHIGIILSGAVDMVKEDIWGNKTMLVRMGRDELFGETFACGSDSLSLVTFTTSRDAEVLFIPFDRVIHTCSMPCPHHHRLIENMVGIIANKNRELMQKIEVVSKKSLREKILAYLSIQARKCASRYVQLPLGRVELADYLCADRSALTRELSNMRREGLIDFDRDCFKIL